MAKIVVAGDLTYYWRPSAWADGLTEAGHEVVRHDWIEDLSSSAPLRRIERSLAMGPGLRRANERLIEIVAAEEPDVVLLYAAKPIFPETVRRLKERTVVAGYDNDDPFGRWGGRRYYRHLKAGLKDYSCHHVFREANVIDYENIGCERVRLLRGFYVPWIHRPTPPESVEPVADITFIGNGAPGSRIEGTTALVRAGLDVKIYGDERYWRRYLPKDVMSRLVPITPAGPDDYRKIVAGSKISVAFFNEGNRDEYSDRSFEIPACGGFMLSQRTPYMLELLDEDSEAAYFAGADELVAKATRYLDDDDARAAIASAGHERITSGSHDLVSRMNAWTEDLRDWGLLG